MDTSHLKDTFIAFVAAILMWKAPALGIPLDQAHADEIAMAVLWLIGKLQKSPVPSLAPAPDKPKEK